MLLVLRRVETAYECEAGEDDVSLRRVKGAARPLRGEKKAASITDSAEKKAEGLKKAAEGKSNGLLKQADSEEKKAEKLRK